VMNVDGTGQTKIADNAREPFWSPDGKVIGYLPQEYAKFNVIDYYTKGWFTTTSIPAKPSRIPIRTSCAIFTIRGSRQTGSGSWRPFTAVWALGTRSC